MSTRLTTRAAAILALACTIATAACSEDFGITEPIAAHALSKSKDKLGSARTTEGSSNGGSEGTPSSGSDWELGEDFVRNGLAWNQTEASAVIDDEGGTLVLPSAPDPDGGRRPYHSLTVPPGAVSRPTRFVMELGPDPAIAVHLSATEVTSGRQITEFSQPLSLALTYAGSYPEDAQALVIAYVENGEIAQIMRSTVNRDDKVVTGQLRHFSRYAVAFE